MSDDLNPHLFGDHLETLARRWEEALTFAGFEAAIVAAGMARNYFLDDQAQGKHAHYFTSTDAIIDFLVDKAQAGDVILVMSNGGFEGFHGRLLEALAALQERGAVTVDFTPDATLQTLYLGTSPGFRKVHSRVEGQDDIRSLPLRGDRVQGIEHAAGGDTPL